MSVTKKKKIGQMSVTGSEICFSGPFNWIQIRVGKNYLLLKYKSLQTLPMLIMSNSHRF